MRNRLLEEIFRAPDTGDAGERARDGAERMRSRLFGWLLRRPGSELERRAAEDARSLAMAGARGVARQIRDGWLLLLSGGCNRMVGSRVAPSSGVCRAPGIGMPGEAATVVQVGRRLGVPERAMTVALVAGLQESGLRNLDYGDRDSLGVFQQRPSQGWGTPAQVRDPVYASTRFYRALADVDGWERMPLGSAAQAVQRSGYPGRYARHEPAARRMVAALTGCARTIPASSSSTSFTNGPAVATSDNPRSAADAVAWARGQAAQTVGPGIWYRRCLNFTAQAYGYGYSGTTYAIDHYRRSAQRHDGDRRPPVGALLAWDTGQRAGHIALYVGGGMVASTDIRRRGMVDVVPASEIETRWHARYLGWMQPSFPAGGGTSGDAAA